MTASTSATACRPHRAPRLSRREAWLLGAAAVLLLAAALLPAALGQGWGVAPVFVDRRAWLGLPNVLDVLSNLPFLVFGVWGIRRLYRLEQAHDAGHVRAAAARTGPEELPHNALDCAWLFFGGFVLVAVASAFYHLQPDEAGRLAADRCAMAVAFAGLVGMAASERISARAGWPTAWVLLAAGLMAVAVCETGGNVVPWAVVQFGGMASVLAMALLRPAKAGMRLQLGWVIALYAVAKLCEMADAPIFEATGELISGHSLKHIVASFAAWPVLRALHNLQSGVVRHNRALQLVTD